MNYDEFKRIVNALGVTAGEVAYHLYRSGFVGRRHSECGCPIARYLRANGVKSAKVNEKRIGNSTHYMKTPTHLRRFMWQFDVGNLPELESGES